ETCDEAGRLACTDVKPIDDIRGSAEYRLATLAALISDGLQRIAAGKQADGFPDIPVLLDSSAMEAGVPGAASYQAQNTQSSHPQGGYPSPQHFLGVIETTINGQHYTLEHAQNKSLLNALREDAGLTGTKEGCAEGECGACTVWINGQAAMSCLVPAPQAHS